MHANHQAVTGQDLRSVSEPLAVAVPKRGDAPEERRIPRTDGLALTHNLGGYPGEMVSFVSILGNELG